MHSSTDKIDVVIPTASGQVRICPNGVTFNPLVQVHAARPGLGMGLAYSAIALVVLETATPGQEGTATAAMQLANVLSMAVATGIGGALVATANARTGGPSAGVLVQSLLMIGVIALALVTTVRLAGVVPPAEAAQPNTGQAAAREAQSS